MEYYVLLERKERMRKILIVVALGGYLVAARNKGLQNLHPLADFLSSDLTN